MQTLSDLISDLDSPHVTDPALKDQCRHRLAQALRIGLAELKRMACNECEDPEESAGYTIAKIHNTLEGRE